jgi:dihydrolipoamide dehydrogenase
MPQLSDTMTEGVVVSWEKQPGDQVERGDTVATVETDKAVMDVEVFREGFLSGPVAAVDSTVPVGEAMAFLVAEESQVVREGTLESGAGTAQADDDDADTSTTGGGVRSEEPAAYRAAATRNTGAAPAPRPDGKAVTPYARKLAGQTGVDLARLTGSGPSGEITAGDVEKAAASGGASSSAAQSMLPASMSIDVPGDGRKMSSVERAISHNMLRSLTIPTFRVTTNVRPEALTRAAKGSGVSVTVAIAKACALAMAENPRMNWAYQPRTSWSNVTRSISAWR